MVARKRKRANSDEAVSAHQASMSSAGLSCSATDTATPNTSSKRQRTKKGDEPPMAQETSSTSSGPPEKREARIRKSCPQNIMERVDRVVSQRFFMVDRKRVDGQFKEEFSVLGSTGNVYTVVIDKKPSCNCPDAMKGNHCKHILFIFLKVLQVSQQTNFWYQKALLSSELENIFANAPLAPNSVANPRIREAFARATSQASSSKETLDDESAKKRRIPGPDDDCPICYDGMHGVDVKKLVFCEECGNAVHDECFRQWAKTAANKLTCVWCRAAWVVAGPGGSSAARTSRGGYINLGKVAGVSPVRDTSSYYRGPSRGRRYHNGYGNCYGYEDEDFE